MSYNNVRNIFINSPASASTARPNKIITGNLFIGNPNSLTNSAESVKIAFSVNHRQNVRQPTEWTTLLNHNPITTQPKSSFLISRDDWIRNGLTWVVATPIFEKTPIKIVFDQNELLEPGFKIEIYTRDALIVREVPLNPDLATGATITFEIDWSTTSNTNAASPLVEPTGIN